MRRRNRHHCSHPAHESGGDDRWAGNLYHRGCSVRRHNHAEDGGDFGCWELRDGSFADNGQERGFRADFVSPDRALAFSTPENCGQTGLVNVLSGRCEKIDSAEISSEPKSMPRAQRSLIRHPGANFFKAEIARRF